MKKGRLFILVLLLLAMLLTSCGGQEVDEVSRSNSGSNGSETSRDSINLSLNQVVETLNPFDSVSLIDYQFHYQIYEPLFFVNDSGNFEPRIAKSFNLQPDNMTYVVNLRDDVKFHNGELVTAEDVAWSLDYMLKTGPYVAKRSKIIGFESAEVIDKHTVAIKSIEPSSSFFSNLNLWGVVLNKEAFLAAESDGTVGVEWVEFGTGPYIVTSYNPDAEINLESFTDYYRGQARIDKVNYKILADSTTTTVAFESGDLDLIVVPTSQWDNINSNDNYNTYLSPSAHTSFFLVNIHNNDPLSNKLVRQALSYAIDRESMILAAYDGIAQPAYSMFNADTVPGGFTVEELKDLGIPVYEYNPDKARQLLEDAGYSDGLDLGSILTISSSYWEKMATVFQSNLRDIGVNIEVELADSAACRARRGGHDYNLATTGTNFIPDASYSSLYFRYITDAERALGEFSELDPKDKELADALEKGVLELDEDARRDKWLEFNRIIQEQMYIIPTFHKTIPYAYNKDLGVDVINTNYYYIYEFYWN